MINNSAADCSIWLQICALPYLTPNYILFSLYCARKTPLQLANGTYKAYYYCHPFVTLRKISP